MGLPRVLRTFRNWLRYMWMLITLRKDNFYRDLNPMTRVYTQVGMVLFSFSITVGKTFFYRIPLSVLRHGDLLLLIWLLYTPILIITAACFAEMAALMPAVGAHYHYCYSTLCEIIAFFVGWNLLFAYTTITMGKIKFLSEFIDNNLLGGWISKNMRFMDETGFLFFCIPGYVDIISPMLAVSMAFQAAWAVRATKTVVNLLTSISIVMMLILIISFTLKMEFSVMNVGTTQDTEKLSDSLYLVHSSLIGYESLSVLGEEAKDPTRSIPLSIMTTVQIVVALYIVYTFTMSACLEKQSIAEIDKHNPLGSIVLMVGMPWLYWFGMIGSVCSLWCSAYGNMFVAIRILYAMSRDGMVFKLFSRIDKYTRKPSIPAMIFGSFTGVLTTFISTEKNVGYPSIIMAKIMTAVCLLITRYRYEKPDPIFKIKEEEEKSWVLINQPDSKTEPTKTTHRLSMILIYNIVVTSFCATYCFVILYLSTLDEVEHVFGITGFISIVFCIIFLILLRLQPTNDRSNLAFITPYVPTFPLLAIVADFISALILCRKIWMYGFMWTVLGIIFYFAYSIRHSQEGRTLYPDGTRWNSLEPRDLKDTASTASQTDPSDH